MYKNYCDKTNILLLFSNFFFSSTGIVYLRTSFGLSLGMLYDRLARGITLIDGNRKQYQNTLNFTNA